MHIRKIIKYNPSLRSYSRLVFMECFEDARREASKQTGIDLWVFEKECDWTLEEVLGE